MGKSMKAVMLMTGLVWALVAGGAFGLDNTEAEQHLTATDGITIDGTGTDGTTLGDSHFTRLSTTGKLYADSNIVISGTGALTIGNVSASTGMQTWDTSDPYTDNAHVYGITMHGGTLTVGNATKGSYLETGAFVMTGGTVDVAGTLNDAAASWANKYAFLTGGFGSTVAIDITGGTVNLGENGRIQSTREDDPSGQAQIFHIGGDAVINMNGDGAMLRATSSSAATADGGTGGHATRLIMDGGTINVNANGYILARDTDLNGGKIAVDNGKKLVVAGSAADNASIDDGISAAIGKWGSFTINGAIIENAGVIDFIASTDMTLNAFAGVLDSNLSLANATSTTNGTTYSKNLHVLEGGVFVLDGDLDISAGTGIAFENRGSLGITGATTSAQTINLDAGSTTMFGGDVSITTGDLVAGDNSNVIAGGDVTLTLGGVTLGKNSILALNNGSDLKAVSGVLAVDQSTKLIVTGNGDDSGEIDVSSMTVAGTDSSAQAIKDYLLTQNSSGLASGKEYTWDETNKKITYNTTAAANSTEGMRATLDRAGNSHLMPGLNTSATDTWADIINITDGSLIPFTPQGTITAALIETYLNNVTAADEQRSVVSALAGWDSAKSLDVAMLTANNVAGRIQGRVMDNNLARAKADGVFGSGDALASAMLNCSFANRFWIGGFGLWEDADRRGFDSGYEYKSGGFITGYDRVFGPVTVGGSFAYTAGSYEDKNSLASDSDIDSYAFNLYAAYNHTSGFFATVMGGYTYSDYDMSNLLTRGGLWNKADFHANTWTVGGSLGYDIRPAACLTITPSVGLYYYTSSTNRFATTLANSMKAEQDSAELPVDLTVNYTIPTAGGNVRLTANTGYAYSFSKDGGELDAFGYNGIAGSRISGIKGRENARHTWNIGAGVNYQTGRFDFGVKYDYYAKSDYDAHRVLGTVGVSF